MLEKINIHSLPFLITSSISTSLPIIIFLKNKKSRLIISFLILGISIGIWQFPYFIIYNLSNGRYIIFLLKIAYIGMVFISPATYQFVCSFLNLKKKLLYLFYTLSFIFIPFIIYKNYIISGFRKYSWGYCTGIGNYYSIFLIIWIIPVISSLINLYKEYKKADSFYGKRRIKYLIITLIIGYSSLIDSLPLYGFDIYPFGFVGLIISIILLTYGILNYRLLDIKIIINRLSVITFIFLALISILYISIFYFKKYYLFFYPILLLLFFSFIYLIKKIQEKELTKKILYKSILKREIERITKSKDIEELIIYFIRDLTTTLDLDSASIFILNKDKFILKKSIRRIKNIKKLPSNLVLDYNNPITKLLENYNPLIRRELEYYITNRIVSIYEGKMLYKVLTEMQQINAEIIIGGFCGGRLLNIVSIGNKLNSKNPISNYEIEMLTSIANAIAQAIFDFNLKEEKVKLIVASQNTIINAIEAKDSYTKGHTERVTKIANLIGERLASLNYRFPSNINNLNYSAQLHDVGKIGIKDSILLKNGPLTEEEWIEIRKHPLIGVKIIEPVREWLGDDICDGIIYHHENYDGSGYPFNRKKEEIPIFARIIRVADSFDAMVSSRPYREALTKEQAMEELNKYKDIYFDPIVVKALEDIYF